MSWRRISLLLPCAVLVLATFLAAFRTQEAAAAQITARTLTLQTGTTPSDVNSDGVDDGGSTPGGTANHLLTFTVPSIGDEDIGSIRFDYCTTADINIGGTCTTPNGLDTTSAALGGQTGATGFSIDNTTNGSPFIARASASSVPADTAVTYTLDDVVNPDDTNCGGDPNCSFFVRITTYTGLDGVTGLVDSGTVTASTTEQIVLTGTMPESLIFCTGEDITAPGGIPDCTTATAGDITFNQLFSPVDTATATSEMAASTNAISGYAITVNGPTLTSGANTIPTIGGTAAASAEGTGQFGLNLVANDGVSPSGPVVGADITPASGGATLQGNPAANYDTANTYAFVADTTTTIANSDDDGTSGPTDAQIYTVSYIVNVSGSQVAGTYATTLTYICTPTF